MGAAEKIRPEHVALTALDIAPLFGLPVGTDKEQANAKRYVLERLSLMPGFPAPCTPPGMRRAWIYADVLAWREANRDARQARRRSSRNRT